MATVRKADQHPITQQRLPSTVGHGTCCQTPGKKPRAGLFEQSGSCHGRGEEKFSLSASMLPTSSGLCLTHHHHLGDFIPMIPLRTTKKPRKKRGFTISSMRQPTGRPPIRPAAFAVLPIFLQRPGQPAWARMFCPSLCRSTLQHPGFRSAARERGWPVPQTC